MNRLVTLIVGSGDDGGTVFHSFITIFRIRITSFNDFLHGDTPNEEKKMFDDDEDDDEKFIRCRLCCTLYKNFI